MDTQSINITHTYDKINLGHILFSKCIIRQVLSTQQWKNPFEEKSFSIQYTPQTYDCNDYRMHGFGHFFITQRHTRGFSIFMTIVQTNFLPGFTTGGHVLDAVYQLSLIHI